MGRARGVDGGGMIYHALNRATFRSQLFRETAHYADFLGIVEENLGQMGVEGGSANRPGKHDAQSRAPEKRFLAPFSRIPPGIRSLGKGLPSSRESSQHGGPLGGRDQPLDGRFQQSRAFRESEEVALVNHSIDLRWTGTFTHIYELHALLEKAAILPAPDRLFSAP